MEDDLNEEWKNVMNDPTVTMLTHDTRSNRGKSFLDDDMNAFLARGLALAERFRAFSDSRGGEESCS
jgi:hypothetical protein